MNIQPCTPCHDFLNMYLQNNNNKIINNRLKHFSPIKKSQKALLTHCFYHFQNSRVLSLPIYSNLKLFPFFKACKEEHPVLCLFLNRELSIREQIHSSFLIFHTGCKQEVRAGKAHFPLNPTSKTLFFERST